MLTNMQFAELIDQEIDFIGQLYVEYEQLTSYEDILTSPEKRITLASLFHDFVDRIFQLLKQSDAGGNPADVAANKNWTKRLTHIFVFETLSILDPYFSLYDRYLEIYPERLEAEKIVRLYHLFPQACENVARDLRGLSKKLRGENAG